MLQVLAQVAECGHPVGVPNLVELVGLLSNGVLQLAFRLNKLVDLLLLRILLGLLLLNITLEAENLLFVVFADVGHLSLDKVVLIVLQEGDLSHLLGQDHVHARARVSPQ